MDERLWGLPFLLLGLYYGLMPRDRLRRHADRSARQAGAMFPWMNQRRVRAEARTQYVLLRLVPPLFIVLGALVILGVLDAGEPPSEP